jgi:SPP1 family predicted phage head-tail adaptor
MSLAAGRLRHRVEIWRKTVARGSDGVSQETRAIFAEVWAEVAPVSGREFIQSGQLQSEVVAKITIRALPGLRASDYIVFRDQVYNVQAILTDLVSGLEYFTLPVSMGVNDG